jgi:hypothetical protein
VNSKSTLLRRSRRIPTRRDAGRLLHGLLHRTIKPSHRPAPARNGSERGKVSRTGSDTSERQSRWRGARRVIPWGAGVPVVRSPRAAPADHNLPAAGSALVGRDKEVARLCELVLEPRVRLVTLTGVGGYGKTRLALAVASQLVGSFKDGVWLVALAPLADSLLMPSAVASALGVRERPDRLLLEALAAHLAGRQLLLVLDNCEHLVDACAELAAALLQGCPGLRILASSRQPLQIADELAWRVPPLGYPEKPADFPAQELEKYAAVQLFVERAVAVHAGFTLAPHAAPAVAAICARLEGIPLAIELAAAWVRVLGVNEILERLDGMFGLLVGGSRSAPSRQRTMRSALDWSYGLLAPAERLLLQRLAVFVEDWSLAAAEAVCQVPGPCPTRCLDCSLDWWTLRWFKSRTGTRAPATVCSSRSASTRMSGS